MKISTEIGSAARIVGEKKAIEYVAKAGFDAWDFSMIRPWEINWDTNRVVEVDHPLRGRDYLKFARELKRIGLDNGIVCNQSHAPFPSNAPIIRDVLKRAVECTAEAGGQICVIHPVHIKGPEENAEMYADLLSFAQGYGVKIATENMWAWNKELDQASFAPCATPESFCAHVDALNNENMVACLDIGHAEMRGIGTSAVELIKALGSRLQALHIHDNDKWHDSHQIPFAMDIDFVPIVKALKEVGYTGYFTLEADCYLKKFPAEKVQEGINDLARAARKLAQMYENANV